MAVRDYECASRKDWSHKIEMDTCGVEMSWAVLLEKIHPYFMWMQQQEGSHKNGRCIMAAMFVPREVNRGGSCIFLSSDPRGRTAERMLECGEKNASLWWKAKGCNDQTELCASDAVYFAFEDETTYARGPYCQTWPDRLQFQFSLSTKSGYLQVQRDFSKAHPKLIVWGSNTPNKLSDGALIPPSEAAVAQKLNVDLCTETKLRDAIGKAADRARFAKFLPEQIKVARPPAPPARGSIAGATAPGPGPGSSSVTSQAVHPKAERKRSINQPRAQADTKNRLDLGNAAPAGQKHGTGTPAGGSSTGPVAQRASCSTATTTGQRAAGEK